SVAAQRELFEANRQSADVSQESLVTGKMPRRLRPTLDTTLTGYIPSVFVFFPLPYRDPKMEQFSKTIRDHRITLMSRIGCPYGKIGRSVLSLITTQVVQKQTAHIELGSIR